MRNCLIIIFSFFLLGCKQSKDGLTENAEAYFDKENIHFNSQNEMVFVVPVNGCPGCVADGIKFITENQGKFSRAQNKNAVVFTGIVSKKLLYRRLDEINFEQMAVAVDTTGKYMVDFDACDYPLVLHLENGKILKAENQYSNPELYENLRNDL